MIIQIAGFLAEAFLIVFFCVHVWLISHSLLYWVFLLVKPYLLTLSNFILAPTLWKVKKYQVLVFAPTLWIVNQYKVLVFTVALWKVRKYEALVLVTLWNFILAPTLWKVNKYEVLVFSPALWKVNQYYVLFFALAWEKIESSSFLFIEFLTVDHQIMQYTK